MKVTFSIDNAIYIKDFNSSEEMQHYIDGLLVGMIHSKNVPSEMRVELLFNDKVSKDIT